MKFHVKHIVDDINSIDEVVSLDDVFIMSEKRIITNGISQVLNFGDSVQCANTTLYVNEDNISEHCFHPSVQDVWHLKNGAPPSDGKRYYLVVDDVNYSSDMKLFEQYDRNMVSSQNELLNFYRTPEKLYIAANNTPVLVTDEGLVKYDATEKLYEKNLAVKKQYEDKLDKLVQTIDPDKTYHYNGIIDEENLVVGFYRDNENNFYVVEDDTLVPLSLKGDKGADGRDGVDGKDGRDGVDGKDGRDGVDGKDGRDGVDGKDGRDGVDGAKGEKGDKGADGRDGKDADITKLELQLDQHIKDSEVTINSIYRQALNKLSSQAGGGGGGSGSAKLLDNDDVEFNRPSQLSNNDILYFDSDMGKFRALNIVTIINNIKAELEVQYNRLVDVNGAYTYVGEANPGTASSASSWRIKRIEDTGGGDLDILWADGNANFDNIWDDRASYTYS